MHSRSRPKRPIDGAGRTIRAYCAVIALITLPLALCTGCGDEMEQQFRQAAIGGVETGVNAIVSGLLDGVFAIATPSETTDTTATDTTTGQ